MKMKYKKKCMIDFHDDITQVLKVLKREVKILNHNYVYSYYVEKATEKEIDRFREKAKTLEKSLDTSMSLATAIYKDFFNYDLKHDRHDFFVVNIH